MQLAPTLSDYFLFRDVASTTQTQYRIAANQFDQWNGGNDIDERRLSEYLKWYQSLGKSPNTVRHKRSILLALLAFSGCPLSAARVRRLRRKPSIVDSWSPDEVEFLCRAAGRIPGIAGRLRTKKSAYTQCLIRLAFQTALRRGDLIRVTVDQVHQGSWDMLQSKTNEYVDCEITAELRAQILAMPHVVDGAALAFAPWCQWHADAVTNLTRKAMRIAWMDAPDGCLKKLRRSSITEAERLQPGTGYLQAGHTSPIVTNQSYNDRSRLERKRPGRDE